MLDKYIDLLLTKCLSIKAEQPLLIYYDKENQKIINKIKKRAKELGVNDIYEHCVDSNKNHRVLKKIKLEDIKNNKLFDRSVWNDYAKKNSAFLMVKGENPGLMDDISLDKLTEVSKVSLASCQYYRKLQKSGSLAWCIAALPTKRWAKKLFPDEKDAYNKLFSYIYKMCMVDGDPIKNWDKQIEKFNNIQDKLNNLNLKTLHYTNSLGTDLYVGLTDKYHFSSAGDNGWIENMPTYEVFASPHYLKTNGIVYSSKPLIYAGSYIEDFFIEFKNGEVINYDAKKGKEVLKKIIETDKGTKYLGEVALVNYKSPISKINKVFETTLIDENASCHLALGDGFSETYEGGLKMSEKELIKKGINKSKNHVDFMIGTKDLKIDGITKDNKTIPIFKNGNFTKEIDS